MKTFLDVVADEKRREIAARRESLPLEALRERLADTAPRAGFQSALMRTLGAPISIIAEVKARAPGRSNVAELTPEAVVADYAQGGASAVSVLTDERHFGGSMATLEQVSAVTDLPLLHKEFIVDEYQLMEGRLTGASAALILAYYFSEVELGRIVEQAKLIGVEPVVECSLEQELPRTLAVDPEIMLLNNRAIASIPADPAETYNRGSSANAEIWWRQEGLQRWHEQGERLMISASCVESPADANAIARFPFDALLVGNAAMVASDRPAFLRSLQVAG